MCGICGFVLGPDTEPPRSAIIKGMCDSLRHRGPDEQGIKTIAECSMGVQRLSIIDLKFGSQPMSTHDGRYSIVYNGEIYNYRELREELKNRGHQFITKSDTEVVLNSYAEWGSESCNRINGMFSFAIWDDKRKHLFLARDRLGIKPLFYSLFQENLIFSSELRSILKFPGICKEINQLSLSRFLSFEYIPTPLSIIDGVNKLPPGHFLSFERGVVKLQKYWQLDLNILEEKRNSEEELKCLVSNAVRKRLMADVPVGVLLSGGIDSSIIVALASEATAGPIQTFSLGFSDQSYDETYYAELVSKKYNTSHNCFYLDNSAVNDLVPDVLDCMDEPLADFSTISTYLLSKKVSEHVKVALSGDGGDELFLGYDTYRAQQIDAMIYQKLPSAFRKRVLEPLFKSMRPTNRKKGYVNKAKRFLEGANEAPELQHLRWMLFYNTLEISELFSSDYNDESLYEFLVEPKRRSNKNDELTKASYIDVHTYLTDNILNKVDRMSMSNSLELRVPLLDHEIVEFAFTLPSKTKLSLTRRKKILVDSFKGKIPIQLMSKKKQGFSVPIKNWLKNELKDFMMERLSKNSLDQHGFFDSKYVNLLINEHLRGVANHSHKLWSLIVFQSWYQKSIT
ncbi:MAG: asparagine synthase (glutamine-hydrolyzing) [Cyclobacteriaceae bacterium]